jgi:hypothetical protein
LLFAGHNSTVKSRTKMPPAPAFRAARVVRALVLADVASIRHAERAAEAGAERCEASSEARRVRASFRDSNSHQVRGDSPSPPTLSP